jgi:small subunit ribosomal protein S6
MSAVTANLYETIYILRPGVSESDAGLIHQKIDNVIQKFSGQLQTRDDWGIKEMAYPISREGSGRYTVIVYSGKGGVVEEIERHFRITDDVLRYITVSVNPQYDYDKIKKQIHLAEEEVKKNREARKKGQQI